MTRAQFEQVRLAGEALRVRRDEQWPQVSKLVDHVEDRLALSLGADLAQVEDRCVGVEDDEEPTRRARHAPEGVA